MTRLREALLQAVEDGHLSVDEIVRAALREGGAFRAWAKAALERTRDAPRRRPQVRAPARHGDALLSAVLAAARRRLGRRAGVVGVSWGSPYRRGRPREGQALVVWVEEKRSLEAVPGPQRIPEQFTALVKGKRYSFRTDVQPVARGRKQAAARVRAGNRVSVQAGMKGTLGALVAVEGGWLALISGHVVTQAGSRVVGYLGNGARVSLGEVQREYWRNDAQIDASGARPVDPTALLDLSLNDCPVHVPGSTRDIGLEVRVRRADGDVSAKIDATDAPADFGADGRMVGLVRLDALVSRKGDSGAPVLAGKELVGFVVGAAAVPEGATVRSHTYLIPARRVLDAFHL